VRKVFFTGVLLAVALPLCAQSRKPAPRLPGGIPDLTPTHIFFLFEASIHTYRQIFMDGRTHPTIPALRTNARFYRLLNPPADDATVVAPDLECPSHICWTPVPIIGQAST
jgi:hypothetical protein